jgi:hypothetical protein
MPISAVHINIPAPGQCKVLNKNAKKAAINVSEATMKLNFSILPKSFVGIAERRIMKSIIPEAVPQISSTFAPGQCMVLKNRPINNRNIVMIEVILMVLFMADNELVINR